MKYKIIDSHCHPQLAQYDSDRHEVITRTLASGVGMVCVGTDVFMSRKGIELAEQYEGVYTSVGSHPTDESEGAFDLSKYEELAGHPKVVAIGEIGLDYFHEKDSSVRLRQKDRFLQQVELAKKISKPLIIHCRDAHEDMIQLLREHAGGMQGVIHSFNGSVAQAKEYIDIGFYLGLNAIITYSKDYEEMVKSLPLEKMLLETDAPYLAPAPYRGKRNEPGYVQEVGSTIALMRGENPEVLFEATTANALRLFSIKE
jgi:TatD DNase family protein